ncbi:LPXTG cell wall anchor domain-containing protein [Kitasatospora albolonga]|uniref:LPXTG cell wall anchor domain-containing protein n=1 Tax=Kitasatospora albolonga TaxID=68173 RepID=UPI001ABF78D1
MKLRRTLGVAAATAVLAPVTLLSASVAVANPTPATEATETSETSPAPQETEGASTPETDEGTPAAEEKEETSPAPGAEKGEEAEGGESAEGAEKGEEAAEGEKPKESPAPVTTSPAPAPSEIGDICEDQGDLKLDKNLSAGLTGLPSKVVAGSGFHAFKLNVVNKGDKSYKRVDLGVFAAQVDTDTWDEDSGYLTLQFKNPETGAWTDISLGADDELAGYLGYTDIRAKESFAIDLRLSVDKKAPASFAYALAIGIYADDQGNCVSLGGKDFYSFDVVAAGAQPGKPNEAEPQTGGKKPVPVKPVGNTEIKPEGTLAQTGSDSNLPVIATIGGVAILAGAGVVFALGRRRRDGAAA